MKRHLTLIALLALASFAQAAVIQIDLSPAGTDAAIGLSPLNEVPAVTNAVGSGGEVSGGITFDTDTALLSLVVGYGSAAGFADLTGPAIAMHLHGPAGVGTNAGPIINLMSSSFPAGDPATGGLIFGSVLIPTNEVDNLLAGLLYLNIHTETNTSGELRAQLIPLLDSAPEIVCPDPVTAECGSVTRLTVMVSDADDDALTLIWTVNGTAMQTNELAAGSTATPVEQSFDALYQLGVNEVSFTVTDSTGKSAECSTTVTVVDTTPPVISQLTPSLTSLWPPNHKMVPVSFTAVVADACGATTWKIISITSSEAVNARGSGNTSPDWEITGDHTANLLAERSGITGPRVYTITVEAEDASGNVSEPVSTTVTVPHNSGSSRGPRR
jgi:hypothetical protein